MLKYKEYSNGLRLVHNELQGYSVSIGIFVKTGSVNENDDNNGISHFIEHTLFKGTESKSAFQIADEIESIGAQINAYTSKQCTAFYTVSISQYARQCAEILSDMFFNATFPQSELKKEKGVVIEEINMYEDTPDDVCLEQLSCAFYEDSPLGRTILGSKKNVRKFKKSDILEYMARRYTPKNTVISIAGNISFDEADKIVSELFEPNFKNSGVVEELDFAKSQAFHVYKHRYKDIEQSNVAFAFKGVEYESDMSDAVSVLNNTFGGAMSSRLFQKVREDLGLAYSVYSYPSSYTFDGDFTIYLGTNPTNTKKAILAVRDEIEKIRKNGVTDAEVVRGINQIKSAYLLGQESSRSMMSIAGKYLLYTGKLIDIDERIAEIDSVNVAKVNEAINYVFDFDRVCASYVGREKKIQALGLLID